MSIRSVVLVIGASLPFASALGARPAGAAMYFQCNGTETLHIQQQSVPTNFVLEINQQSGTMTNPYSLDDLLKLTVDEEKYAGRGTFGSLEQPMYVAVNRKTGLLTLLVDNKDKPNSYPLTVHGKCQRTQKPKTSANQHP